MVWTDLVGTSALGNDLTKTAASGWGNAGAASTLTQSGSFAMEFTADSGNRNKLIGLSSSNTDAHWNTINFAIYLTNSSTAEVYENGVSKGSYGSFSNGDKFKIERSGTTILYKKNGTTFYTSAASSTGNLLVDAALYYIGSKFIDVMFIGVPATAPAKINDLSVKYFNGQVLLDWTAPYDNGSAITEYEIQYGTVVSGTFNSNFTDDATAGASISGLTNGTDYQFRVVPKNAVGSGTPSNVVQIRYDTRVEVVWTDVVGVSVSTNNLLMTASSGWGNAGAASTGTFSGDGGVEFVADEMYKSRVCGLSTSNANANYTSIHFGIYLYPDATVRIYESGTYKGTFGSFITGDIFTVYRTGSTITYKKNNITFYTSAASSSGSLLVDAALYDSTSTLTDVRFVGVSAEVPSAITDLTRDFGDGQVVLNWSIPSDSGSVITGYDVQYGTVTSGTFASTYSDDAVPGATVTGLTNGTAYQFRVVAKNTVGSSASSNVVQVAPNEAFDIIWSDMVGVSVNGADLTKTASTSWGNAGAASNSLYENDISAFFTVEQLAGNIVAGLSDSNTNANYSSIDYGLHMDIDNDINVYENGTLKATGPTYAVGDILSVEKTGSTVVYKKNGTTFYTSTVSSSTSLLVDVALYYINTKLTNVRISGQVDSSSGNPTPISFGDTVEEIISPGTDMDAYEFTAQAGDLLYVPFSGYEGTSGFTPEVELVDSSSTVLTGTYTSDADVLTYTISSTGTYSLYFTENSGTATGKYSFTLQRRNNPGGTQAIDFGISNLFRIDPRSEVDVYELAALNGDHVNISFSQYFLEVETFDPAVSVYTVDGTLMAAASADVTGTLGVTIPSDGNYYIWVTEREGNVKGYYNLAIEENLVGGVSTSEVLLDPAASQTTTIYFTLERDADVTIRIYGAYYGQAGYSRSLYPTIILNGDPRSAGVNTFVWDGKDLSDNIFPSGAYVYTITAVSPGRTDLYDPEYVYGFVEIANASASPANFDPYRGEVATLTYDLPVAAWVTLDVGVIGEVNGKKSLVNLGPRDAGANTEIWNGRDDQGNIVVNELHTFVGWAVLLPENGLIIKNNSTMDVEDIQADPYAFFPIYGEATRISFDLAETSFITLEIVDTNNDVVRTLLEDDSTSAGSHTVEWDGRDEVNKVPVEEGDYRIRLTITQASGPQVLTREGNVTVFR
ncbi:MAG: fibronectin type III domain-containing protein [Candidatus Omnitrophota bacterium]